MRRKCGENAVQMRCKRSVASVQVKCKCGESAVKVRCKRSVASVQKSVTEVVEMTSEMRRVPHPITDITQEHSAESNVNASQKELIHPVRLIHYSCYGGYLH